jgi:hypothetical protein
MDHQERQWVILFRRIGTITGLLIAILSDLRRRAWWAYRSTEMHRRQPIPMIIAQRPVEATPYVPQVTPPWRAVAETALPVIASALLIEEGGTLQPIIWIKADQRPDVGDLPRVLRVEQSDKQNPLVATQWLADLPHSLAIVVITYIEPVACTWAISFNLHNDHTVLEHICTTARLFVAFNEPSRSGQPSSQQFIVSAALPTAHLSLPIESPHHLRAILNQWAEYSAAHK